MEIRVANLSRHYGAVRALDDVSLTISDGELFFLLGPSGCGKTTLLRCVAGFEQPTSGKVFFDGRDVTAQPANLRDTAMVFQGYALFPHLTVFDNVSFGLEMKKVGRDERKRRVVEALRQVQLEAYAARKPNELSGGQQQRVALARTLVVHPGCLLLDEPLANLDAKLRRDMRLEIRRLCKDSGLTAIYVTHDRQEALSMADRIAVFRDGRICQLGTPTEVYRRPSSAFVANFIGETNLIPARVLEALDGGARLATACGEFRSLGDCPVKPGGDCLLSLRPEVFRIGAATENMLEVTVEHIDYLGELADHIGRTADGQVVKFFELNPGALMPPGTRVTLSVAPEDLVVLPPDRQP